MGSIEVAHLDHVLPNGRTLFSDVSFRVGDGSKTALIGANGTGKTTLLRIIAGDLTPVSGTVGQHGGLGVMRQFIGSVRDDSTVRDLLISVAAPRIRTAARELDAAEAAMIAAGDEPAQMRYAAALADWGDIGGYAAEVEWDTCCGAALGMPYDHAQSRMVRTLSGGEQKRLVLEALLRGSAEVLVLDEPDNFLDVPGKQWLEARLRDSAKTVLFVSHDRELLANVADRIVTLENAHAWVYGGSFRTYDQARQDRHARMDELVRRWDEEHERLRALVRRLREQAAASAAMASRYHAVQTRLRRFEDAGPPPAPPVPQAVTMRLRGGRTGVRAITCRQFAQEGLMRPFDLEIFFGERVAVLGSNGSGKSQFLRVLAAGGADAMAHEVNQPFPVRGMCKLGARVVPGYFRQTHEHPEFTDQTLLNILWRDRALQRGPAMSALRRYELDRQGDEVFDSLSGGQQARFQILLLDLSGATLLVLDEPTDNLDLASADALQRALDGFEGTIVAITHDRWFADSFDRFVVFGDDAAVFESPEPVWDVRRVRRAR